MLTQLHAKLASLEIKAPVQWNTDKPTRDGSHWFIGKEFEVAGLVHHYAWFGDYKRDLHEEWHSEPGELDSKARKEIKKHVDAAIQMEAEAKKLVWESRAIELAKEWETFSDRGTTAYLTRKNITGLYGARVAPNEQGDPILVIPLMDLDGKIWNYQRIYSQKLSKGDKFFKSGARIEGLFHVLSGDVLKSASIYVCEGFATAASVAQALGTDDVSTICAFNAGNLQSVVEALLARREASSIVVCADNDAYTTRHDGSAYNVGLEKGRIAAGTASGQLRYPVFKHPAKGLTDFNDLHAVEGLDEVREQLLNPKKSRPGIEQMPMAVTKSGRQIEPSEQQVADYIIDHFGDTLIRSDDSLFVYKENYWHELDRMGIDRLKELCSIATGGKLSSHEVNSYFATLKRKCPQAPHGVDFFQPNPFKANFQNGTLHFVNQKAGKYSVHFAPHSSFDYLTSILPFNFPGLEASTDLPPAPMFDMWLNRLWNGHSDQGEKIRLMYQIMGACLISAFPTIVLFIGPPKSGKSTLIKLMVRLLNQKNTSNVQMCNMREFAMETMIGKLVNYDTDIDVNRPIEDSMVKKLIDRSPVQVNRKNRSHVLAYLPAVHLFAGNKLPPTRDGDSGAYGRRFIIVKTDALRLGDEEMLDYDLEMLEKEGPAIVARAVHGLLDLAARGGKYSIPESSADMVRQMEAYGDPVSEFFKDVSDGQVLDKSNRLIMEEDAKIERKNLWEIYSNWQEEAVVPGARIGKHRFFEKVESRGKNALKTRGVRYFVGMRLAALDQGIG